VNTPERGVFVSLSYKETLLSLYVESSWDEILNFTYAIAWFNVNLASISGLLTVALANAKPYFPI
jgi:hypothetical protein